MNELNAGEESVMKETFKATMLRAAAIIDAITADDVTDAQMALYHTGVKLPDLQKVDRALIASCHLRACVDENFGEDERARAEAILSNLQKQIGRQG
jgi:hypothetical protein